MTRAKKPETVENPEGSFIGYARVSTAEQNLDMQIAALKKAGCVNIYDEKVSSAKAKRPKLALALKDLQPGDTFVVWRLDRLARNIGDLLKYLELIDKIGAKFLSLTEKFDTSTAAGRLMLHITAAFADFERQLTIERTHAGLQRAKERGQRLGAQRKITDKMIRAIRADLKLRGDKAMSVKKIAAKHGVSTSSIYALIPGGKLAL
jgi:DNA invertase Pin-like site-specific DNA recombinase